MSYGVTTEDLSTISSSAFSFQHNVPIPPSLLTMALRQSDSLLFSWVYSSPGPVLLFWTMSCFLFGLVRSRTIAQKNGRIKRIKEEQKFNIILPLWPILFLSSLFCFSSCSIHRALAVAVAQPCFFSLPLFLLLSFSLPSVSAFRSFFLNAALIPQTAGLHLGCVDTSFA